jgi:hypothetical protein
VVKDQAVTVSVQTPVDMAATRVRSASPLTEPRTQTQLLCEQQELENMDMMNVDAVLPTRAVAYEHDTTTLAMSSSSEMPAPATPCPRPEGYGLDCGDRVLYSSSPESSSPCSPVTSPPCSPVPSSPITIATTTVQARQVITLPVFDPTTLLLLLDTPPLIRKPKRNTSSSPKTNAGKQMLRRDLFPILEGNSHMSVLRQAPFPTVSPRLGHCIGSSRSRGRSAAFCETCSNRERRLCAHYKSFVNLLIVRRRLATRPQIPPASWRKPPLTCNNSFPLDVRKYLIAHHQMPFTSRRKPL